MQKPLKDKVILSLSLKPETVKQAKLLAVAANTTVSQLFENLVLRTKPTGGKDGQ